ncbi:MAG: alpha/beta hydrolase-fold protein [bacterium]
MKDPQTEVFNGVTFKTKRPPNGKPKAILVMIHGWTGSETSTWILTEGLSEDFMIIAPRGFHKVDNHSGYGWADVSLPQDELWEEYQRSTHKLFTWLMAFLVDNDLVDLPLLLGGFSQGAMISYYLMLLYPGRFRLASCLAGAIMPQAETLITPERVRNARFYIAHGTRDKIIPVHRARRAVQLLQQAGADVTYCESDIGHKASPECYANLIRFLNNSLD